MTPVAHFRLQMQELLYPGEQTLSAETTPAKVRLLLQELGPTFVKLGQMVTSRARSCPKEWRAEFKRLQSDVAPFPYDEAVVSHRARARTIVCGVARDARALRRGLNRTGAIVRPLEDGTPVAVRPRADIDVIVRAELNAAARGRANVAGS